MAYILIVDDDQDLSGAYTTVLKNEGYEIGVESDPAEAIRSIEKRKPDLILLDVMFPENKSGGFDLARKISKQYSEIRILMLTSINRHYEMGFSKRKTESEWLPISDIMEKPVDFEVLKNKIKELLKQAAKFTESTFVYPDKNPALTMPFAVDSLSHRSAKSLEGQAGAITDFCFDRQTLIVKYVIVTLPKWILKKTVAVDVKDLLHPAYNAPFIELGLSQEQIGHLVLAKKIAPTIFCQRKKNNRYGMAFYLGAEAMKDSPDLVELMVNTSSDKGERDESGLLSGKQMFGWSIFCRKDEEAGKVEDFVLDESLHTVLYILCRTGEGDILFIPSKAVEKIDPEENKITLNLSTNEIKSYSNIPSDLVIFSQPVENKKIKQNT
jgi:DNA-binding response OmpR family regulator